MKLFNGIQEEDGRINVDLGDDTTYPMSGMASISYQMPSNIQCRVGFEGQCSTINDCSLASSKTLARGVQDGGLSRLFVSPMELVHKKGS